MPGILIRSELCYDLYVNIMMRMRSYVRYNPSLSVDAYQMSI